MPPSVQPWNSKNTRQSLNYKIMHKLDWHRQIATEYKLGSDWLSTNQEKNEKVRKSLRMSGINDRCLRGCWGMTRGRTRYSGAAGHPAEAAVWLLCAVELEKVAVELEKFIIQTLQLKLTVDCGNSFAGESGNRFCTVSPRIFFHPPPFPASHGNLHSESCVYLHFCSSLRFRKTRVNGCMFSAYVWSAVWQLLWCSEISVLFDLSLFLLFFDCSAQSHKHQE